MAVKEINEGAHIELFIWRIITPIITQSALTKRQLFMFLSNALEKLDKEIVSLGNFTFHLSIPPQTHTQTSSLDTCDWKFSATINNLVNWKGFCQQIAKKIVGGDKIMNIQSSWLFPVCSKPHGTVVFCKQINIALKTPILSIEYHKHIKNNHISTTGYLIKCFQQISNWILWKSFSDKICRWNGGRHNGEYFFLVVLTSFSIKKLTYFYVKSK